jgi:hypothetical protein
MLFSGTQESFYILIVSLYSYTHPYLCTQPILARLSAPPASNNLEPALDDDKGSLKQDSINVSMVHLSIGYGKLIDHYATW